MPRAHRIDGLFRLWRASHFMTVIAKLNNEAVSIVATRAGMLVSALPAFTFRHSDTPRCLAQTSPEVGRP